MRPSLSPELAYGGQGVDAAAAPRRVPLATVRPPAALELRRLVVPLPRGPLTIEQWRIEAGEKVAMIGRNGVGKTSVTEALLGLREGCVVEGQMLGVDIARWRTDPSLRKRLGVQLQKVAFPGRPRVRELVKLHRAVFDRTSEAVIEALGLPALSDRLYEFLSRGETQRVDLFLAMAHEPEILFLDEPFTGLDPQFAKTLASLIRGMQRTTIVMSCHTIEELGLVDKIAWLSNDGIARFDTPDALRHQLVGDYKLSAQCDNEAVAAQLLQELGALTAQGQQVRLDGCRVHVAGSQPLADLARTLVDWPGVLAVESGRSSLSDVLRHCAKEA